MKIQSQIKVANHYLLKDILKALETIFLEDYSEVFGRGHDLFEILLLFLLYREVQKPDSQHLTSIQGWIGILFVATSCI